MSTTPTLRGIKGMNDVRPNAAAKFLDSALWQHIQQVSADVLSAFGFRQVILPTVEDTGLFARGIGEETDIVAKEMYSFEDRGGRALTLRPEGTAGAVRAYLEHGLASSDPIQKWWYFGPMFRAERPQKGRYRQFYQIGAEYFGVSQPEVDAELISCLWTLCTRLGLGDVTIRLNSLGDSQTRSDYRLLLRDYLQQHQSALCESCERRQSTNPLRVLDCKRPQCQEVARGAPDIATALSPTSKAHFERLLELLGTLGVPFERDGHLVRGLDYYTETIFEFTTTALGAQDALLGGGRYNDLVAQLGGPPTPAIGFAAGIERLALVLGAPPASFGAPDLYIVPLEGLESPALALAQQLRSSGKFKIEVDLASGRLKQQMKRADRSGARFALVLGEQELEHGQAKIKDLRGTKETSVAVEVALTPEAVGKLLAGQPILATRE